MTRLDRFLLKTKSSTNGEGSEWFVGPRSGKNLEINVGKKSKVRRMSK